MSNLRPLMLAFVTCTVLLGQKYEIHLSPRNRPGDVFLYSGKGTRLQQMSIAGQIAKQEEISAELKAKAEVLDVDASEEPVRVALTVSSFTKSENGAMTDLLEPGSVVLIDGGAEDPVSLKGGKISEEGRKAFDVVFSAHKPDSATDDDIFGTKELKAFGESWGINSKRASEDLKKSGIEVSPEHVKGRIELVGRDRVGEVDCLSVHAELMASGVAMKDLPQGAIMDEGTMKASFEGCVPVAGTSTRKSVEMTLKARFILNDSTYGVEVRQKSSEIWKVLPK